MRILRATAYALRGRGVSLLSVGMVALALAACANSTPINTTLGPLPHKQWVRPLFPNTFLPTVSTVAFADSNAGIGYACTATLSQTPGDTPTTTATAVTTATPTATAVATATSAITPTPTLNIPGRPTTPPTLGTVVSAFWDTTDGGQTWKAATLPVTASDLLCPVSAIVAPTAGDPNDVFFLAAEGNVDLQNPTSIQPGQLHYGLWRSRDGAKTWTQLTLPTTPNPLTPLVLQPYHLVIITNGTNISLASNQSGANALFTSADSGQTWKAISANTVTTTPTTSTADQPTFAGFASGANGTILALIATPTLATTVTPYTLWQTADFGTMWQKLSSPALSTVLSIDAQVQIFSAPGGHVLYLLAQASTTGGAQEQTATLRSGDGGATWSILAWPTSPSVSGAPLGLSALTQLGAGVAIDAAGDAFIAPTKSDLPLAQDAHAQESAGIYEATANSSTWTLAAAPNTSGATTIGLTVSTIPQATVTNTTPTVPPTNTVPPTITATATVSATATTPAGTGTAVPTLSAATPTSVAPTPTTAPAPTVVSGTLVVWTNFGPLTQFTQNPNVAGFFEYLLS